MSDRYTILLLKSKSSIHKGFRAFIFLSDQNFSVAKQKPDLAHFSRAFRASFGMTPSLAAKDSRSVQVIFCEG